MLNDPIKFTGEVYITVYDEYEKLKEERYVKNLVVTVGKEHVMARLKESTRPNQMSHMEVGQSATATSVGQTDLVSPFGTPARVALTTAGGSISGASVTYSATFPAGTGTGAIQEAGIFNASSGGTMLCRTTFAVINKAAGDTISITWIVSAS